MQISTFEQATLHCGDSRVVLPELEPTQFTSCVCDPPYHLKQSRSKGFMGKTWDGGDIAFRLEFWDEVLRVLKPGAMLLAFGGTRTFHRLTCAIEDAGFEIRDCLMWLYGSGFPKSLDISKALDKAAGASRDVVGSKAGLPGYSLNQSDNPGGNAMSGRLDKSLNHPEKECSITAPATELAERWDGWGTSLKPAWEPIIQAMKPLDGTFARNAHHYGVAGLNIDGSRIGVGKGGQRNDEKTAKKRYVDQGSTNFAATPGPRGGDAKGRWPANLLLDEHAGEMLDKQSGGASRFFYCAKANKRDRTCDGQVENKHPTVKPRSLMEYLCRLVTPPGGGLILDPFMGSGSTGIGALLTGNRFVGIELEPESFEIARQRIEAAMKTKNKSPTSE